MIIVVCTDLAQTHPTDTGLGRLSIVGGGSVYPMAQNLCLALRARRRHHVHHAAGRPRA